MVVRNARGVLSENGSPSDLLVSTGTEMIDPETYDLVIDYKFSRKAPTILEDTLAAVNLRPQSRILVEVRFFRGSYRHPDGEKYDCLDRSRPCSNDTNRTYPEPDDDGTLHSAPWSSKCGCIKERTIAYSSACPADHGANMQCPHFGLQERDCFFAECRIWAADTPCTNCKSLRETGSPFERSAASTCKLLRRAGHGTATYSAAKVRHEVEEHCYHNREKGDAHRPTKKQTPMIVRKREMMERMFRLTLPKTKEKQSSTSAHTRQINEFGKVADTGTKFSINCTAVRWTPVLILVRPKSTRYTVVWDYLLDEKDRTNYKDSADEDAEAVIHYRRNRHTSRPL
ncbi:hypothetical protein MRX96_016095 [Rhipicephalus microplus]